MHKHTVAYHQKLNFLFIVKYTCHRKHHHHFWFYIRDKETCVDLIFNINQNLQPVGRWKFNKQLKHNGQMRTKPGIFH